MPTQRLTPELISAAIEGFLAQKARIDVQIAELKAVLSGGAPESATATEGPIRKRRKMSAAGRKAIAEGQRKRWAKSISTPTAKPPSKKAPAKRKMSAARKAALIANLAKARAARAAKRAAA